MKVLTYLSNAWPLTLRSLATLALQCFFTIQSKFLYAEYTSNGAASMTCPDSHKTHKGETVKLKRNKRAQRQSCPVNSLNSTTAVKLKRESETHDQSRFNLSSDDIRVRVWRPRGKRLNPAFALQLHTAPTAGVMVWGTIAYNTWLPLVLIRGTITAQQYPAADILQPHVFSLMQRLPGAIFQQDNAQSHTTRVLQDCLHTVTTLPWPALAPDFSPIENIWDHLGLRVGHPTSLNELEARLQQIWNEMSQDLIQNLYASMPDRIAFALEEIQQGIKSSVLLPFYPK
ncbi:transposable element Tcb2 transposase [Trichonephila clavipes]|nr:transposable element Tcb2 transposase [Trichonephila clavipes]